MTIAEFKQKLEDIKQWQKGSTRAPHKPLLLLYAIGQFYQGKAQPQSFESVRLKLRPLLKEFGIPNQTQTCSDPRNPFCRLENDFWNLFDASGKQLSLTERQALPSKRIRELKLISGGLSKQVIKLFNTHPDTVNIAINYILENEFSPSYHDEILEMVGLYNAPGVTFDEEKKYIALIARRNPVFRRQVLKAYKNKCAMCNYGARLDKSLVALEAAHIQWFCRRGPDQTINGLALCSIHHKALDRGAIGISDRLKIMVSSDLKISSPMGQRIFDKIDGQPLRSVSRHHRPDPKFLQWHFENVYRG